MKSIIAMLASLLVATGAAAQVRAYDGPFTASEAQVLSAVWPEIRAAANYEDIDWSALGLNRAPGSRQLQRVMSANWGELKRAQRFEEIDWNWYAGEQRTGRTGRGGAEGRFERGFPGPFTGYGPFTRDESQILAELWPQIREAARFGDIDWRAFGLARAPGDVYARDLMAAGWDDVRREERFQDIDWERFDAPRSSRGRQYAGGFGGSVAGSVYESPFTREEEATMSRVWGEIREAAEFDDIDWRAVGFSGPPGGRDARRILAQHWGALRQAARFEDIDWAATTGAPRRVLR